MMMHGVLSFEPQLSVHDCQRREWLLMLVSDDWKTSFEDKQDSRSVIMGVNRIVVDPVAKFQWQAQERELLRLDGCHAKTSQ